MEDDAAETACDDDRHLARRAIRRGQHRQRGLCRVTTRFFRIYAGIEQLKAHQRTGVARAGLVLPAVAGDSGAEQTGINAGIAGIQPFAVGDQHMLFAGKQPRGYLHNACGYAARRLIHGTENARALLRIHGQKRRLNRMNIRMRTLSKTDVADGYRRIGHSRGGAFGGAQKPAFAHVTGIDINRAQSVIDAHARTIGTGKRSVFNSSIAQGHGKIARILDKEFGKRAAARQGASDHALAYSR